MRGLLCAARRGRHTHQSAPTTLDISNEQGEPEIGAGVIQPADSLPLLAPPAATLAALPREVLLRVAVLAAAPLSAW